MILSPSTQKAMGSSCIVQHEPTTTDHNFCDRSLEKIQSVYQSGNEMAAPPFSPQVAAITKKLTGIQNEETQSPIKNKLTRDEINDKLENIKAKLDGIKTEYPEVVLPQTHLSISGLTLTERWADINEQLKKPLEKKRGGRIDDSFLIFFNRLAGESQGGISTFSSASQKGRDLLIRNAIHSAKNQSE